jgi:hypothetical protein
MGGDTEQLYKQKNLTLTNDGSFTNDTTINMNRTNDNNPSSCTEYEELVGLCVIRDLDGLGFDHIGSKGQEIIKAVLSVASDNYPGTDYYYYYYYTLTRVFLIFLSCILMFLLGLCSTFPRRIEHDPI